jgi:hypothetical protein
MAPGFLTSPKTYALLFKTSKYTSASSRYAPKFIPNLPFTSSCSTSISDNAPSFVHQLTI